MIGQCTLKIFRDAGVEVATSAWPESLARAADGALELTVRVTAGSWGRSIR
jgi:hypothetical protein